MEWVASTGATVQPFLVVTDYMIADIFTKAVNQNIPSNANGIGC